MSGERIDYSDETPHNGSVIDFGFIPTLFGRKLKAKQEMYVTKYYEAQVEIKDGNIDSAKNIFLQLEEEPDYLDFEADNEDIMSWIRALVHDNPN